MNMIDEYINQMWEVDIRHDLTSEEIGLFFYLVRIFRETGKYELSINKNDLKTLLYESGIILSKYELIRLSSLDLIKYKEEEESYSIKVIL